MVDPSSESSSPTSSSDSGDQDLPPSLARPPADAKKSLDPSGGSLDDRQSSGTMSDQEKAEKKREYNRLAQREFRKRRKEHLRNLETAQKEKQTEQSQEIERLRNDLLRMQQRFGPLDPYRPTFEVPAYQPVHGAHPLAPPPPPSAYQPIGLLSGPAPSRRTPSQHSIPGPLDSASVRHHSGGAHGQQILITAASPHKLADTLKEYLKPVVYPHQPLSPNAHLTTLQAMTNSLPQSLRPTEKQLTISHSPVIDMLPSPTLRDRLVSAGIGTAQNFLEDVFPGLCRYPGPGAPYAGGPAVSGVASSSSVTAASVYKSLDSPFKGMIVWGEDPLNENGWEASQEVLDQWSWLMGNEWVRRANFWRAQRNLQPLADY